VRRATIGDDPKGWLAGPWDGTAPVAISHATAANDEPHLHTVTTEVFLVAAGTARAMVDGAAVEIGAGDVLIVEPGEPHAFVEASEDYRAFVLHAGGDGHDKVPVEPDG
jgi:mannose-6-phosphate isomerase-like protein (cupin superfamily)